VALGGTDVRRAQNRRRVPRDAEAARLLVDVRTPRGVEPTNNAAEQAIRRGVLWRKGSFGMHSPDGSRFVEAMMTIVAMLKQQHLNVLDHVTALCEAVLRGETAPSLITTPADIKQLIPPLPSLIL
jgi:transposase